MGAPAARPKLGGVGLEHQQAAGMPAAAVVALAAGAAGEVAAPRPVRRRQTAAGAAGDPAGDLQRHRVAVAERHLKLLLGRVDRRHAGAEMETVNLAHAQHPVDPGVDHLVAEGAEDGLAGQWLQQRPRQHDLAEGAAIRQKPAAIETGRAGEAAIAPAQSGQRPTLLDQRSLEVLAIEPVEEGQQGFEGHGGRRHRAGIIAANAEWWGRRADSGRTSTIGAMDWELARTIGTKTLLAGAGALLLFWTISAVKLVLNARRINPLLKQFFNQVAAGQIDGAYLLTTKNYRSHVNRQQFIRFLAGLQLNKYRNLKSGRPRLQEDQIILTVKLKSEGNEELPLDFTFIKVDDTWRVDRIQKLAAA